MPSVGSFSEDDNVSENISFSYVLVAEPNTSPVDGTCKNVVFSKLALNSFMEFVDNRGAIDVPANTISIMNGIAVLRVLLIYV